MVEVVEVMEVVEVVAVAAVAVVVPRAVDCSCQCYERAGHQSSQRILCGPTRLSPSRESRRRCLVALLFFLMSDALRCH